jgi:pimeloyl-ACP methyl ester carboxylesterase
MNPLHFGPSERPLFGIYYPPARQPGRNRGVVLCNPFGDEAIKAHRAYLALATRLAAERFHVLRFDYSFTGDSAGASEDGRLAAWLADVGLAADELKDASGASKLSFVGLRLGGTLAFQAAQKRKDLDRVVLWDPVVSGPAYLAELRQIHLDYLVSEMDEKRARAANLEDEVMGLPLPPALRGELEGIDLVRTPVSGVRQATLVSSSGGPATRELAAHLRASGVELEEKQTPMGINWNSDAAMSKSLVPAEALDAIVTALGGEGRGS